MDRLEQQAEASRLLAAAARELAGCSEAARLRLQHRRVPPETEQLVADLFEKTQAALQIVAEAHMICRNLLAEED